MKSRLFSLRWIAILAFAFGLLSPAWAANPFVHPLFTSHMVLQRDAVAPVWGWTTVGNSVSVQLSEQNGTVAQTKTAVADSNGRWQVNLDPISHTPGNPAYSLVISDSGQTVTLTDVLIGDVILCSGQSNMDVTLATGAGVPNQSQEVADSANYPSIRCFTVPRVPALTEQETISGGSWVVSGTATTTNFSATAYFTARELYKRTGIPVGILVSSWGGTQIHVWVDKAYANSLADYTLPLFDMPTKTVDNNTVTSLFNGMIHPLAPFRLKGALWYQGEGNSGRGEQYSRLLPGMMGAWRTVFGQPDLPFVIVQLPNVDAHQTDPVSTSQGSAEIREAQLKTVQNDSNSRLAVTIDLGGEIPYVAGASAPLHPRNKQDVGQRTALAFANMIYGQDVVNQGPLFTGATVSGSTVECTFSNVGAGLMVGTKNYVSPLSPAQPVVGGTLRGFALAGSDGKFYFANARITGSNTVLVSSTGTLNPVAVRYGWGQNPPCNLYNSITDANGDIVDGIPASPFRNDPVYRLAVNSGNNGGLYSLGTVKSITATNYTGQSFHHWSGDTACLSSTASATVNATVSQTYVSVLANYTITAAPGNLVARAQPGRVALTWNSMNSAHYNLKRSTSAAGPYTAVASDIATATLSYLDTTVSEGNTYYYKISAESSVGEGPDSAPVSVTVQPTVHNLAANMDAEGQVPLSWDAFAGPLDYYRIKRSVTSGGPYTTLATGTSLSYTDLSLVSGVTYYYVISAVSGGVESPNSVEIVVTPNLTATPAPFTNQDIGNVVLTGSASSSAGTYTVTGAGADIWGFTDAFHYAYQTLAGDGSLTARIASVQNTHGNAKAGVMMRATLAGNSPYAFALLPGSGGNTFNVRPTAGALSSTVGSTSGTNQWVRLVRSGSTFTCFYSSNGSSWTQMGSAQTIAMPDTITMGLAVTSHDTTKRNTSTFDNLSGLPVLAPTIPSGLKTSVEGPLASLSWNAAMGATGYQVKRAIVSGGPYTTVATGINAVTYDCTGLTAGTTYYYVVSALNSGGESANSSEVAIDLSSLSSQPSVPTGFNATAGNGQITLAWDTSAIATRYNLKRSSTKGGPYATIASPTSATYTDTGLANGTPVYYVVSAVNADGESVDSAQVAATPQVSVTGMTMTSNLNSKIVTATGTSPLIANKTSVGINELFSLVSLSGSQVALQSVASGLYVSASNSSTSLVASRSSISANETFYYGSLGGTLFSLQSSVNRLYVSAANSGNNPLIASGGYVGGDQKFIIGGSNAVSTTSGLSAAAGNGKVTLKWNSCLGAGTYSIKRASTSGGPFTEIGSTYETSYMDSVVNGATYYYVVSGLDYGLAVGGPNSSEVSATPQAQLAAPTGLSASPLSETQVRLNWTNNAPSAIAVVVERSISGAGGWTALTSAVSPSSGTYTDSSASSSTSYDYRIQCTGTVPSSAYATVTVTTPAGIGDGIAGSWRHQYFGNGLTIIPASAALADPDGDGAPNQQEYLARTNPLDPASAFQTRGVAKSGSDFVITFSTVPGGSYVLEKTSSLGANASWSPVQDNIAGTGAVMSGTDFGAFVQPKRFYRVRVK